MIPFKPVAKDLLDAASAQGEYPYVPVIVDAGGTADPGAVLAVLSTLIRMAGERTDIGIDALLHTAEEIIVPGLADSTLTANEAVIAGDVLVLARHDLPLQERYGRATAWVAGRDFVDALAVTSVGVQFLQFIESVYPGTLAQLADDTNYLKEELS